MPRVRNHAAEYARLKARAQAAGLSTRGFRRARKAEPEKYYSHRAQVTLAKRTNAVAAIVAINKARGAQASETQLAKAARKNIAKAPIRVVDSVVDKFDGLWEDWEARAESGEFDGLWEDWEDWAGEYDYDDYHPDELLYYHD